jgi:hypothetical protein
MFILSNCNICGKRRGNGFNHRKCSKVRAQKLEKGKLSPATMSDNIKSESKEIEK